jgi:hypothetical protein
MTAEATSIADTPLVTLEQVRRHIGYPRMPDVPRMLDEQATAVGLTLQVHADWAGRLCLTAAQAGELVSRLDARDQAASQAEQRRKRAGDLAAMAAQQRSEQRAQMAYQLSLQTFGDEGVALHLAHRAYRQDITDEQLTGAFGAAGERWRQGYRTLAPQPVAATSELQEQVSAEIEARQIDRTGQVPERSLRRLAKGLQKGQKGQR